MDKVDTVSARLSALGLPAAARAHASAVAKYSAQASTPGRNKRTLGRKAEHLLRFNFTKNNKGRWTWRAKVTLPAGSLSPCLDSLPPGALQAAWQRDSLGEFMLYINFECLIHHNTLRKILGKEGLLVLYVRGLTVSKLRAALEDPSWERLERVKLT